MTTGPFGCPGCGITGTKATGIWRKTTAGKNRSRQPRRRMRTSPSQTHRPTARQEWLATGEGQMPAPPAAVRRDDVRMMGQLRPLRAEERIYVEPQGAPEIGRRPLDLNTEHPSVAQNGRAAMRPIHLCQYTYAGSKSATPSGQTGHL